MSQLCYCVAREHVTCLDLLLPVATVGKFGSIYELEQLWFFLRLIYLRCCRCCMYTSDTRSTQLDNIRVMVIVWRLRGNIIRTALCLIVWHNIHSPQHTYVSSSYRSNRLGLSHWDPYTVHRGDCLELYYCNMVERFWWDSSLISTSSWFPLVLWHCRFCHLACKTTALLIFVGPTRVN